jgi:hypothetical protein
VSSQLSDPVPEHRERLARAAATLQAWAGEGATDRRMAMEALRLADVELINALVNHIDETEGDGGLYDEIMTDKPRLAHAIDRLRREHLALLSAAAQLIDQTAVRGDIDETRVRSNVQTLVRGVERHQRLGLELLHQAYDVDIGEGD